MGSIRSQGSKLVMGVASGTNPSRSNSISRFHGWSLARGSVDGDGLGHMVASVAGAQPPALLRVRFARNVSRLLVGVAVISEIEVSARWSACAASSFFAVPRGTSIEM